MESHYVIAPEEDSSDKVLAFFQAVVMRSGRSEGDVSAFHARSSELWQRKEFASLVSHVCEEMAALLAYEGEEEVVNAVTFLCSVAVSQAPADEHRAIVENFTKALDDGGSGSGSGIGSENKAPLRLQLLTNMFNMLPQNAVDAGVRKDALVTCVRFAARSDLFDSVRSYLADGAQIAESNDLGEQDLRELYRLAADATEGEEGYEFVLRFLETYNGAPANELAGISAAAARAVMFACENPIKSFVHAPRGLLSMDAVRHLQASNSLDHSRLSDLARVFSAGRLDNYCEFYSKHSAWMEQQPALSHEKCQRNIRLLTLGSLAMQQESISYGEIVAALQLEGEGDGLDGEVEAWVVDAIAEKLIQARMDQLERVVVINWSMQREFGQEQWRMLGDKLNGWKDSVAQMLETIRRSRQELSSSHQG